MNNNNSRREHDFILSKLSEGSTDPRKDTLTERLEIVADILSKSVSFDRYESTASMRGLTQVRGLEVIFSFFRLGIERKSNADGRMNGPQAM